MGLKFKIYLTYICVTLLNTLAPRYWKLFANAIVSTRKTGAKPDGGSVANGADSGGMSALRAVK